MDVIKEECVILYPIFQGLGESCSILLIRYIGSMILYVFIIIATSGVRLKTCCALLPCHVPLLLEKSTIYYTRMVARQRMKKLWCCKYKCAFVTTQFQARPIRTLLFLVSSNRGGKNKLRVDLELIPLCNSVTLTE